MVLESEESKCKRQIRLLKKKLSKCLQTCSQFLTIISLSSKNIYIFLIDKTACYFVNYFGNSFHPREMFVKDYLQTVIKTISF